MDGKIVKEINNNNTNGVVNIEINTLKSGFYMMNLLCVNNNSYTVKKIIVK